MKKALALLIVLVMMMSICISAFADEAAPEEEPENSNYALLNQAAKIFTSSSCEKQGGYLAKNALVKVIKEEDGKALIQWDKTARFKGKSDVIGWVDLAVLDMIPIEELGNYCISYADAKAWSEWLGEQAGSDSGSGGSSVPEFPPEDPLPDGPYDPQDPNHRPKPV